jgi:Tol biopolymer transport system component
VIFPTVGSSRLARVVILTAVVTATAAACLIGVPRSGATFRGTNGLLVYQARAGKHIQLFTIRPDGTGRRLITRLVDSDAINPEWSPDGRRIVFARDYAVGTAHEHLDIVTINADGGGLRRMALRGLNGDPTWSRDGRILWVCCGGFAFSRGEGNGSRMIRVAGENSSPTFSPDGSQIAFAGSSASTSPRSSSSTRTEVVRGESSPRQAGSHTSSTGRPTAPGSSSPRLSTTGSSTGHLLRSSALVERLHDSARRERPAAADAHTGRRVNNGADSWSPDGKRIAFVSDRGGGAYQIYVMNADGTHGIAVTHTAEGGHLASWGTHP